MTGAPEKIGIECPGCREVFEDWVQRSLDALLLDAWSGADLEEAAKSECPRCGHTVQHDSLIQRKDGVWQYDPVEDPD